MTARREIIGRHLIADLDGVDPDALRDVEGQRRVLRGALEETGHTILDCVGHEFTGGGFTLLFLLAESHLSVHTYPERGYLAFDLFSCGAHDPEIVLDALIARLAPRACRKRSVTREAESSPRESTPSTRPGA